MAWRRVPGKPPSWWYSAAREAVEVGAETSTTSPTPDHEFRSHRLAASLSDGHLNIACADHVRTAPWAAAHSDNLGYMAAVVGDLRPRQCEVLVDRLASHDDPGSADPGKPWAAIVLRNNGELAFTCSPMWHSGLFYTRHEPSGAIAVATDPGELLRLWPHARELDGDYLLDFILLRPDAERTPYSGIHRLTPGDTAVAPVSGHAGLAPLSITTWSGPAVWPPAFRQGPGTTAGYLEVFDAAVERS